jgi:GT2 family glycosyltransferase
MISVSVIIPYYRELAHLEHCLEAIRKNTHYPLNEVVIVSDGSPDAESAEKAAARFREGFPCRLFFHRRNENRGFAYTCNEGADIAKGDLLCFLNMDTIPQPGWLSRVCLYSQAHTDVGILGSKLIYPHNQMLQHVGGAFGNENQFVHIYQGEYPFQPFLGKNRELQWVTGACLFISKKDFQALAGFEVGYGSTSEDTDLCFKMRFHLGKKVVAVADSVLYHVRNVTGVTTGNMDRTKKMFLEKWGDKVIGDEASIYSNDGFSPEMVGALRSFGFPLHFSLFSFLLQELDLPDARSQRDYLERRKSAGLRDDLRAIWRRNPETLLFRYPEAFIRLVPGGTLPEIFRLGEGQLWKLLEKDDLEETEREKVLLQALKKVDARGAFHSLYNLASHFQRAGREENARELFSTILASLSEANPILSGKAAFKLSAMTHEEAEKRRLLETCLELYPAHYLARKTLDEMEPGAG